MVDASGVYNAPVSYLSKPAGKLKIKNINLQINSLGTPESRLNYRNILVDYFSSNRNDLDEDSLIRLEKNPLRILDSKNPDMKSFFAI